MKQRKADGAKLLDALSKKTDLIPGVPILEIADHCRVLIENHRGIMAYSPAEVTVRVLFGSYRIEGGGLKIAKMGKDQLVIKGRIDGVRLDREC